MARVILAGLLLDGLRFASSVRQKPLDYKDTPWDKIPTNLPVTTTPGQSSCSYEFIIPEDGNKMQLSMAAGCAGQRWVLTTKQPKDCASALGSLDDTVLTLYDKMGAKVDEWDDIDTRGRNYMSQMDNTFSDTEINYVVIEGYAGKEGCVDVEAIAYDTKGKKPADCPVKCPVIHKATPWPGITTPYTWGSEIRWHLPVDGRSASMKFHALCDGQTFNFTVNTSMGTLSDSVMHVYDDNANANVLAFNDDVAFSKDSGSSVNFTAPKAGAYYLAIDGYAASDWGTFTVTPQCNTNFFYSGAKKTCGCTSFLEAQNFRFTELPFQPYQMIQDDPELVNMQGQKIMLYGTGKYSLVEVPRQSPSPMLKVVADIQPLKRNPCDTFIVGLDITGSMLGYVNQVQVHAGNSSHEFAVRFGRSDWMSLDEMSYYNDGKVRIRKNKQKFQVVIDLGQEVHLKIAKPHLARGRNWNWLNVFISGMRSFDHAVGGVLGLDTPDMTGHPCSHKTKHLKTPRLIKH